MSNNPTKKCPFCGEEINTEAIKCRFCREFLDVIPPKTPQEVPHVKTPEPSVASVPQQEHHDADNVPGSPPPGQMPTPDSQSDQSPRIRKRNNVCLWLLAFLPLSMMLSGAILHGCHKISYVEYLWSKISDNARTQLVRYFVPFDSTNPPLLSNRIKRAIAVSDENDYNLVLEKIRKIYDNEQKNDNTSRFRNVMEHVSIGGGFGMYHYPEKGPWEEKLPYLFLILACLLAVCDMQLGRRNGFAPPPFIGGAAAGLIIWCIIVPQLLIILSSLWLVGYIIHRSITCKTGWICLAIFLFSFLFGAGIAGIFGASFFQSVL